MNAKLQQSPGTFKVLSLYKFADLADCAELRGPLHAFCTALGLRGTIILAPEGINGTVAGTAPAADALLAWLRDDPIWAGRLHGAQCKIAFAPAMPFHRLKVRLKPEIVTLRAPEADPSRQVGTYVAPDEWNALIAEGDVLLLDTRNRYETALGSFAGAVDPGIASFVEFKRYVADHLDPARDRKVAMFCTGGIRCEKASAYLLAQGFEEVFHLQGGILAYLERVPEPDSRWQGECFVFDERVAVSHGLRVGDASLCRGCRHPLTAAERGHQDFRDGVCCPHCAGDGRRQAAAAERQRQSLLASQRGEAHFGAGARAGAARARLEKQARRSRTAHRAAAARPG
jgi:UPF0176 protein